MNSDEIAILIAGVFLGAALTSTLAIVASRRASRRMKKQLEKQLKDAAEANLIRVPIPNPAPTSGSVVEEDEASPSIGRQLAALERARDVALDDAARLRRQVKTLTLELERVEAHDAEITEAWRQAKEQMQASEVGLVNARREIAEIRGVVLELGATKTDQEVIDLR